METIILTCRPNQWTGFYMVGTSVIKELNVVINFFLCYLMDIKSNHPEKFCKRGALKHFAKFIGKHLCRSLFLTKLQA